MLSGRCLSAGQAESDEPWRSSVRVAKAVNGIVAIIPRKRLIPVVLAHISDLARSGDRGGKEMSRLFWPAGSAKSSDAELSFLGMSRICYVHKRVCTRTQGRYGHWINGSRHVKNIDAVESHVEDGSSAGRGTQLNGVRSAEVIDK
jgi:hypothetical protein